MLASLVLLYFVSYIPCLVLLASLNSCISCLISLAWSCHMPLLIGFMRVFTDSVQFVRIIIGKTRSPRTQAHGRYLQLRLFVQVHLQCGLYEGWWYKKHCRKGLKETNKSRLRRLHHKLDASLYDGFPKPDDLRQQLRHKRSALKVNGEDEPLQKTPRYDSYSS
jgi:hypothetical protein